MSRPVFLYLFERGVQSWHFAAAPREVLALSKVWGASSITHSDVELSGDVERDAVRIVLPLSDPFAADYVRNRPDGRTFLTIYRYDRSDSTYALYWSGRVTGPETEGGIVTLRCEPDNTGLAQSNRTRIFMRPCPHALYYGGCRLERADFRVTAPLLNVAGAVVTIEQGSDIADGEFDGGVIEAGNGDTRAIKSQAAGVILLVRPLPALLDNLEFTTPTVSLYPGCNRTPQRCTEFANPANESGTNIENYGGFQWMLTGGKNPFGGSSVT